LGLDLVERLIADATVLQARLAREAGPAEQRAEVASLEERLQALRTELDQLKTERAALENDLLRATAEEEEAAQTFAAVGGKHVKERHNREVRLGEVKTEIRELDARLVALAAGELPLALVPDLLARVDEQDAAERLAAEAAIVQRLLAERDRGLLEALRSARAPARLLRIVEEHLKTQGLPQPAEEGSQERLNLSNGARSLLHHLRGQRLAELVTEGRDLLARLGQAEQEREDLDRALAATPQETDIGKVVEELQAASRRVTLLGDQARRLDEDAEARKKDLAELEARLQQLLRGKVEAEFERQDQARMIELAGRTRETMQEFLRRATESKIDRLAHLITESFRFLLRKQTLVERIRIDPATFALTLYDNVGHAMKRERLSEGEKQIFAISILWGLARAAARPLPAVIDTPLARLDATHRQNLVERYFPHASHQVILFSTDTEVDRGYYQALQPHIARAYHLNYDEQTRATTAEEGYFWRE
jgi:DNA sulfur modification protein DndD